ncbi:MAG: TrkH family potassium uptake protein [Clostridiales bacterium]|nr:TrkH family potassium uptake protein [Clostridiales bacterium]
MNHKMILNTAGLIVALEGGLLLLPTLCALCYAEWRVALCFLATAAVTALVGGILVFLTRRRDRTIYAKEGFVIVALGWVLLSAFGAIPFVLTGDIPAYHDAFFETVSGLTTTGASILTNIPAMSHGCLFWRSFTHWIGGMGVLVLIMAILPDSSGRSIHVMRAEMPGPVVDKIVPRVRDTAKILYFMYFGLTLAEVIFLMTGGMSLFEALIHSFGTAGTGGFSTRPESIGAFSPYLQWVITVFMLLFGVNFNLYYLILIKRFKSAIRSEELWMYLGLFVILTGVIAWNIRPLFSGVGESIRQAAFQVASIGTTTGYATADFNLWPNLSRMLLLLLMFVGGCAGSTAGGLKVARIGILLKSAGRELNRLRHPRSVNAVRFEGKPLSEETRVGVVSYFALYALLLAGTLILIGGEPFDMETNISAAISCFNNVGPGFSVVGPAGGYADYSVFAKMVLSAAMLLGRLEIYPIVLSLSPSTWRKK